MAAPNPKNDDTLLKNLVPLNTLTEAQYKRLQHKIVIKKARKGEYLFRQGDTDHQNIYLLSGTVALLSEKKEMDVVHSGTQTARFALAHQLPRKYSARAKNHVTYVRIDSRLLSELLASSQSTSYEVNEIEVLNKGDWMSQLLQSPIFQQIPPANLQRVMMRMQEVTVSANEIIIQQGDEGDYFYLICSGQCRVTRQPSPDHPPVELARLSPGQGFGEEALISDKPRSSTVTMLTDGELVRLSKQDFVELVKQPVSNKIEYTQACHIADDQAIWLDIRTPEEYEATHLPGAINLPFLSLRFQAPSLAADRIYLVYGADAGQTSTAAYLLMERGYEVSVVLQDWHEIAIAAGLEKVDIDSSSEANLNLGEGQPEMSDAVSESELVQAQKTTHQRKKQTQGNELSLEGYEAEHKQLKQALADAKRKLELSEKNTHDNKEAQDKELQQLRKALTIAEDELSKYKAIKGSERQAESQLKEMEGKLQQLQSALKATQAEAKQASQKRAELELDLETTRLHNKQQLEKIREEHDAAAQEQKKAAATLEADLAQEKTAVEELKQSKQQLTSESERLKDKLLVLEQQQQEKAELQQQLDQALAQIEALQQAKSTTDLQVTEQQQALEQALEDARAEAQANREALKETDHELKNLDEQRLEIKAKLEQEHQNAEFLRRSLETAENAVEISGTTIEENEQEISRLNQQLHEVQAELASLQDYKREIEGVHQNKVNELEDSVTRLKQALSDLRADIKQRELELEQIRADKNQLGDQLTQLETTLESKQQAYDTAIAEQHKHIDQLEKKLQDAYIESEKSSKTLAEVDESRDALIQAQEQIATLNKTIKGLREVQLEMENQLAEDSEEELQRLRTALSKEQNKRRDAEALAKQADVLRREREVQETAVEMLGEDIEHLTRENAQLLEGKQALQRELQEIRSQKNSQSEGIEHRVQLDEWRTKASTYKQERDQARVEIHRLQEDFGKLHGLIESYVVRHQGDARVNSSDQIHTLHAELERLRSLTTEDLEQVRSQLLAAESSAKLPEDRDVETVASLQALRQEVDSIQMALSEKEQLLRMSQSQCCSLEDAIEDRDKEIDQLRHQLESLAGTGKAGGLGGVSELLSVSLSNLSQKLNQESEQFSQQRTEELTRVSKLSSENNPRNSLGSIFRKR